MAGNRIDGTIWDIQWTGQITMIMKIWEEIINIIHVICRRWTTVIVTTLGCHRRLRAQLEEERVSIKEKDRIILTERERLADKDRIILEERAR
jgi:hypothetical protein